ncbi:hypothetical protein BO221_27400 [Archangium sp. Cb G35]|uniref:imm11 family protein n=1 Tax=Archangium sp. Cb G35 TaxID=1920190 RepID=UPI0009371630|nr:DUF1629 domain-containing protein [Archangium sp. Cb G35]OJT21540.1 hypothetical protein BO221_27400 [Archangium sp. Cb G35]
MSAPNRYFELRDDMLFPDRWVLEQTGFDDQGRQSDVWQFTRGTPLELEGRPVLGIAHPGQALEFSLTAMGTPVVAQRVVSLFEPLGLQHEVQFIPALLEGRPEPYFLLNALRIIRCIDDARCEEVRRWEPMHGNPRRVGEYRNVVGLRVDPAKMEGAQVLRPWGWRGTLIVSERIKQVMEQAGITGTKFVEV